MIESDRTTIEDAILRLLQDEAVLPATVNQLADEIAAITNADAAMLIRWLNWGLTTKQLRLLGTHPEFLSIRMKAIGLQTLGDEEIADVLTEILCNW